MKNVICPVCDKRMDERGPSEWPAWPFCSTRCRLVDLGRWLRQDYAVPLAPSPGDEDEGEFPQPVDPSAVSDKDEA